jgi:hypothetical protein
VIVTEMHAYPVGRDTVHQERAEGDHPDQQQLSGWPIAGSSSSRLAAVVRLSRQSERCGQADRQCRCRKDRQVRDQRDAGRGRGGGNDGAGKQPEALDSMQPGQQRTVGFPLQPDTLGVECDVQDAVRHRPQGKADNRTTTARR